MYDTVYVEYPLPSGYEKYQECDFQTKDLHSFMAEYHILADGRLVERHWDVRDMTLEEVEEDKIFWESIAVKSGKSSLSLLHTLDNDRQVRADTYIDTDEDYHGDVHFYEWDPEINKMIDFVARFTHGVIEWIKPITQEELRVQRYEI